MIRRLSQALFALGVSASAAGSSAALLAVSLPATIEAFPWALASVATIVLISSAILAFRFSIRSVTVSRSLGYLSDQPVPTVVLALLVATCVSYFLMRVGLMAIGGAIVLAIGKPYGERFEGVGFISHPVAIALAMVVGPFLATLLLKRVTALGSRRGAA